MAADSPTPSPRRKRRRVPGNRAHVYSHRVPHRDAPETIALWHRWLKLRREADFQALAEHYTPLITILVTCLKRAKPAMFADDFNDLRQDGIVFMLDILRRTKSYFPGTPVLIMRWVRKDLYQCVRARSWGGARESKRLAIIASERAAMVQELERVPTPQEMADRLRGVFTNPNLHLQFSDALAGSAGVNFSVTTKRVRCHSDPWGEVIQNECRRLALKGLSGVDRKIVKLVMDGHSPAEIGRRIGLKGSYLMRRINGVLWELRCRADLADLLGVEAAEEMRLDASGDPSAIATAPPARRVG